MFGNYLRNKVVKCLIVFGTHMAVTVLGEEMVSSTVRTCVYIFFYVYTPFHLGGDTPAMTRVWCQIMIHRIV